MVLNVGEGMIPTHQIEELLESLVSPGGHPVCGCHPADAELSIGHVLQEFLLDGSLSWRGRR